LNRILVPKRAVDRPFEVYFNLTSNFCETLNFSCNLYLSARFQIIEGTSSSFFFFLVDTAIYQPERLTTCFCNGSMTVNRLMIQEMELKFGEDIELKTYLSASVLTGRM